MKTPNNPFGLLAFLHWNHEWNNYHFDERTLSKATQQLKELGIGMLRVDILWSDVQKPNGDFDFERYDKIVSLLTDSGIRVLAPLQYNKSHSDDPHDKSWSRPPDSYEEFAHYVKTTVQHFKSQIQCWEIWNEPNLSIYWDHPKDNLKTYCQLLKKSYVAAKEADPNCFVINGGITDPVVEDVTHLYKNGYKDYTDAINIHTFIDPLSENRLSKFDQILQGVRTVMDEHGDQDKPIWITEMGCPGIPAGRPKEKWFAGEGVDEIQQAEWLETIYNLVINQYPSVEKLFWAFYRDTQDEFEDSTNYFGLVRTDLKPKRSFKALQKLIQEFRLASSQA